MKVITHYDFDGMLAAGILMRNFGISEEDIFIMHKHGDPIGLTLGDLEEDEEVYITDFSITDDQMEGILNHTKNVIWIDHHDTGRSYSRPLDGIRYYSMSKPKCGALLTWEFLYGDTPAPEIVKLCNVHDVWLKDDERFTDAGHLNFAITSIFDKVEDYAKAIKAACKEDGDNGRSMCNDLIKTGAVIYQTNQKRWKKIIDRNSFTGTIDGYRAICVNCNEKSSHVFGEEVMKHYEVAMVYDMTAEGKYNCSVYTIRPGIACNVICKQRGGGGHPGASGCIISDLSELVIRN